jgi:hypothetical protein
MAARATTGAPLAALPGAQLHERHQAGPRKFNESGELARLATTRMLSGRLFNPSIVETAPVAYSLNGSFSAMDSSYFHRQVMKGQSIPGSVAISHQPFTMAQRAATEDLSVAS